MAVANKKLPRPMAITTNTPPEIEYPEACIARAMRTLGHHEQVRSILSELNCDLHGRWKPALQESYNAMISDGVTEHLSVLVIEDFIRRTGFGESSLDDEIELGMNSKVAELIDESRDKAGIGDSFAMLRSSVNRCNLYADSRKVARWNDQLKKGSITHQSMSNNLLELSRDNESSGIVGMSEIAKMYDEHDPMNSVPTGFKALDWTIQGLPKSRVTILGARPGVGKTDLALSIARHNVRIGKNVLLASIEMGEIEIAQRIGKAECGIWAKQTKEEIQAGIRNFMDLPGSLKMITDPKPTVAEIRARVSRDIDLVIVDYLQIIQPEIISSLYEQTTEISNSLRAAAKSSTAAWLVLSQFSREARDRHQKPIPADLRGSGAIEQDAYMILLMHEPEKRTKDETSRIVHLDIAKNRGGKSGFTMLEFQMESSRWEEVL